MVDPRDVAKAARKRLDRKTIWLIALAGLVAAIAAALIFTGPIGTAKSLAKEAKIIADRTLIYYEMETVEAEMSSDPWRREIAMRGKANDFQREELVRIMKTMPGIADARWRDEPAKGFFQRPLPILLEASLIALLFYGIGWLIAFLAALRQRARRWDRI